MCETVYKDQLEGFEDIHRTYNFDAFVKGMRPRAADVGIQKHFSWDLEVRAGDIVYVRTKSAVGLKTKWHAWAQIYPEPYGHEDANPHEPATVPVWADLKGWPDFVEKIAPTLTRSFRPPYPLPFTLTCALTLTFVLIFTPQILQG
jgi:hypothetical protein